MKNRIFLLANMFVCLSPLYSQYRPCNKLPTLQEIRASLAVKPVGGMESFYYRIGCNTDDSIKKRILYLLDWRWTKEEIEQYETTQVNNVDYLKRENELTLSILKTDTGSYKRVKDSLRLETRKRVLKHMEDNKMFTVSKNIILASGHLGIKNAIPILEVALKDSIHYNPEYVKLALAKLGKKDMIAKVLSEAKYNPELVAYQWGNDWMEDAYGNSRGRIGKCKKLLYIGSQESVGQLSNWLDTSSKILPEPHAGVNYIHPQAQLIWELSKIIENKSFQEMADWEYYYNMDNEISKELILKVRNWLLLNKGRYKLKSGYCPSFS